MNSLQSVRTLLIDYLKASENRTEMENVLLISGNKNFIQKVYDAFFNFIADPTQSPDSLIHLLDTYTSGLDGFSTNPYMQTVVAFACFEALARRRPEVLDGPWETLVWMIVKYSSFAKTKIRNELINFKKTNIATLKFIIELGSPELCPNPCLRLELIRFIKSFNCKDLYIMYYDRKPYCDKVINTLFELSDNFTHLTVDQVPNFSPIDLEFIMEDNSINMGYIMNDCELEMKKSKIIAAVLKLTRNLALLEKEKHQRRYNQASVHGFWHVGLHKQLSACLSFCGLLSRDDNFDQDACIHYLVKAVGNDYLLLNYVIDTLDTIKQVSLCDPDNIGLHTLALYKKDKLLYTLFKGHIKKIPTFQYNQEIYGGIAPAVEYRLRYFQNNTRDEYFHHDSDYDSEYYVTDEDEDDVVYPFSEENDYETDISD